MDVLHFVDRDVLVVGLGTFGGGIGVTRWLCGQGARVTVTDMADRTTLADSVAGLAGCDVEFHLGGHDERDLATADLVVVSPAVDQRRSPFFARIVEMGIPWTTEMNLFLERCPGRVIGVTGTAGKSTTCALIYEILREEERDSRRVWFGGNVGKSLLGDLPQMGADDLIVLELSSFQLESVARIQKGPAIAAITNVWPNHLDRHGDFDAYLSAKLNIFRFQGPGCTAVIGADDRQLCQALGGPPPLEVGESKMSAGEDSCPSASSAPPCPKDMGHPVIVGTWDERLRLAVKAIVADTGVSLVEVEPPEVPYELRMPGRHNQLNAICAATVARLVGVGEADLRARMARFGGLPHRLEHVARLDDVDYYNDSKSTTAKGITAALASFDRPVVLIVGGVDRGEDVSPLIEAMRSGVRAVIGTGRFGGRIAAALTETAGRADSPGVEQASDLAGAVHRARQVARPGDVIILSPGAPSYDEFVNYEDRGRTFVRIVQGLMTGSTCR